MRFSPSTRPAPDAIIQGRLFAGGRLVPGEVEVRDGRIVHVEIALERPDTPSLPILAPGLVDLHVHGFGGSGPLEDLAGMARALARAGTTAFQPTLFPAAPLALGATAASVWESAGALPSPTARVVGLHLEGPFVNPECAGALPVDDLRSPTPQALAEIVGPATGDGRGVRTVTLAPELSGSGALVEELARMGVRVSLGHSRATAAEARAAANAGASGATHLFNAMGPLHHREVGLAGFALGSAALHAEIIGDLAHVGRDAFELALAARGPRGLCLVSDALQGAGTGCDVFHSHGREHLVRDGTAYYPPGPTRAEPQLAGSAMSQLEMVRRLVGRGVLALEEALVLASEAPARALGLYGELGVLAPGAHADVIALDPETLELCGVWAAGASVPLDES